MAWNYSDNEYLKLYRKFLGWEWYQDIGTKVLFLHCLLRANWKAGSWKGVKYDAGQFITSLSQLADETGLTVDQVRTGLNHLISTGEITNKSQSKYRIITVKKWHEYQGDPKQNPKQIPNQTPDKPQTDPNRYKKIRSKEVKKYVPPAKHDIEDYCFLRGFKDVDVDAFMDYNESLGWKMEWHRALDQWRENQKKRDDYSRSKVPFLNMKKRDYDFDAIEKMFEEDDYEPEYVEQYEEQLADDY